MHNAQMALANQKSFKTIVSKGLFGRSLMLFRVENMVRIMESSQTHHLMACFQSKPVEINVI